MTERVDTTKMATFCPLKENENKKMTEKQFKMSVTRVKATGIILEHELSTDEVYNLLMEYKKENEQLKKKNKELEYHLNNTEKELQEYKDFMSLG